MTRATTLASCGGGCGPGPRWSETAPASRSSRPRQWRSSATMRRPMCRRCPSGSPTPGYSATGTSAGPRPASAQPSGGARPRRPRSAGTPSPQRRSATPLGPLRRSSRVDRRDLGEMRPADRVRADHRDARRADRAKGRRTTPVSERRTLAEDCAGANLRDDLAVDLDVENPVQEDEEIATALSLLDERLAARHPAPNELRAVAEDRGREPAFELRLHRLGKGRRLLVAPRRPVAELELVRPEDVDEPPVGSVERVAGKRARGNESCLGLPVGVQQQLERRPGRDGADVEVRAADDRPMCRQADTPADGLREPDPAV